MPDSLPSDAASQAMILGEMRGQLREMVHSMNNLTMKFDGLSREVIGLGPLAEDIVDLKRRIAVLETQSQRQQGAAAALGSVLKSPAVAWLISAAVTAWVLLTGRGSAP